MAELLCYGLDGLPREFPGIPRLPTGKDLEVFVGRALHWENRGFALIVHLIAAYAEWFYRKDGERCKLHSAHDSHADAILYGDILYGRSDWARDEPLWIQSSISVRPLPKLDTFPETDYRVVPLCVSQYIENPVSFFLPAASYADTAPCAPVYRVMLHPWAHQTVLWSVAGGRRVERVCYVEFHANSQSYGIARDGYSVHDLETGCLGTYPLNKRTHSDDLENYGNGVLSLTSAVDDAKPCILVPHWAIAGTLIVLVLALFWMLIPTVTANAVGVSDLD